jgi:hypothetical protein
VRQCPRCQRDLNDSVGLYRQFVATREAPDEPVGPVTMSVVCRCGEVYEFSDGVTSGRERLKKF